MIRLYHFCKDTDPFDNLKMAYNLHVKTCEIVDIFNKTFKCFIFVCYFTFAPAFVLMLFVLIGGGDNEQQSWLTIICKVILYTCPVLGICLI